MEVLAALNGALSVCYNGDLSLCAPDKNILSWFGFAAPLSRLQTGLEAVNQVSHSND